MVRDIRTPSFDARQFQRTISVTLNSAQAKELDTFIREHHRDAVPKHVWAFAEKMNQCAARVDAFVDGGQNSDEPSRPWEEGDEYIERAPD